MLVEKRLDNGNYDGVFHTFTEEKGGVLLKMMKLLQVLVQQVPNICIIRESATSGTALTTGGGNIVIGNQTNVAAGVNSILIGNSTTSTGDAQFTLEMVHLV